MDSDKVENKPLFDFRAVNRTWQRAYLRVDAELSRVAQAQEALYSRGDWTDGEADELDARLDALQARQDALLAQVVVHVPREWVSRDAPDDLVWSDPSALGYLVPGALMRLVRAMLEHLSKPAGN